MTKKIIPLINLEPIHGNLELAILAAFRRVYKKNGFILGEEVQQFEEAFAKFSGAAHGVGVSSGTAALKLALVAAGVKAGDDVLTTPFSFFASASAVMEIDARPRFVDIDPETFNLNPALLEKAKTAATRAVLPVHLYGNPAPLDLIERFAVKHGLALIQDACQAHGAAFDGKPLGQWGDAACFSFYPTKNLGGLGDGGMVVTDNETLADDLRILRNCGRRGVYQHDVFGYNERLDTLQAAALLIKLEKLAEWTKERQALADVYRDELAQSPVRCMKVLPGATCVYHLFTVRAPRRDALKEFLAANGMVGGVIYPAPLHVQPALRSLGYQAGDFPESEKASKEVLSLPLFPGLPKKSVRDVARKIVEFYSRPLI